MTQSITVDVSDIVDGQNIDANDVKTPIANLKTAIEALLNGTQAFDRILFSAQSATIASGEITATKTFIAIDTEAAAASDDLDTINGGSAGRLILMVNVSGRTVVLKHGTGNLYSFDSADVSLSSEYSFAILLNTGSQWLILANTGGSSSGITYSDVMKVQVFS
jgi:hypothetical protein